MHENHFFFVARSTNAKEVERPFGGETSGDVNEAKDWDPDLEDE